MSLSLAVGAKKYLPLPEGRPMSGMRSIILLLVLLFQTGLLMDPSLREDLAQAATPLEMQIERLHARSSVDRARAAQEIGRMGSYAASAVPDLVMLLGDNGQAKSWMDRLATAIYGALNPLAETRTPTVGEEAMMALVMIGSPAVEGLLAVSRHHNDDIRSRSVWALRLIGDPRAGDTFTAGLRDRNGRIRYESLWGITGLKGEGAVILIAPLLDDDDGNIRTNAINALGTIGGQHALVALTRDLMTRDVRYRITSCEVLGTIKNADPVPMLIALLKDAEWSVRMSSAQALGLRKDKRAVRPLIDAISDPNDAVKNQAGMALTLMSGATYGSDKAQWEKWWKENAPQIPASTESLYPGRDNH